MRVVSRTDAPTLSRDDGLVSHLLNSEGDAETDLTVTWVEVEPGASQQRHAHDPEQVYVLVAGEGVMSVDGEKRAVEAGDMVHIPSNAEHGIENTGDEPLEYVSAATPAIPQDEVDEFYER